MTDVYQSTRNKEKTMAEFATATKALIENDIDMIICEVCFDIHLIFCIFPPYYMAFWIEITF